MTINTTNITSGPYLGNGLLATYDYDFKIADESQLSVYETDDIGIQSLLVLNTDYTVTGVGVDGGGTITRIAGVLPTDYVWYIRSNYTENQLTAFSSQGAFLPKIHENQFDHLTVLVQQLRDAVNRSFKLADIIDIDGEFIIDQDSASRVNKYLAFDDEGNLILNPGTPFTFDKTISVVNSIYALIISITDLPVFVTGFWAGNHTGGGHYKWDATVNKNTANGGTIIDPANIDGFDGTISTFAAYLAAQGTGFGAGCWVLHEPSVLSSSVTGSDTDGVIDYGAALQVTQDNEGVALIPKGSYVATGMTGQSRQKLLIADDVDINGVKIPFVSIADNAVTDSTRAHVFIEQNTTHRDDTASVFIQRLVNTDDSIINPKALKVKTIVNIDTAQTEWAVSGELDNYSDTASSGNTAISGVSNKYGLASVFGGHLQAKDWNIFTLATDVTPVLGVEINTPCVGLDHPTANAGFGNRFCADIIARTNESVVNWDTAGGNDGDAEIGTGVIIRTDSLTDGYFRNALVIHESSVNPNSIVTGIRINTTGDYGIRLTGSKSIASIYDSDNSDIGLLLGGTYTKAAIRLNSGQYIAMEGTSNIKNAYGVTANIWGFYGGVSERVGFDMTASPKIRIAGDEVIGQRKTGWALPSGTATRTTFDTSTVTLSQLAERVKALIDDLTTHGLIGA